MPWPFYLREMSSRYPWVPPVWMFVGKEKLSHDLESNTAPCVVKPMVLLTYLLTHLLTYLLTYSMVQSPSWEANWFAASQEIPLISRNPKDHYRTRKRPPPVSILGQPNPVHSPIFHLLEIHPNIIHPSTPRSPQWSTHRNTTYPVYWDGQKLNITIPGRLQTAYNL